MRKFLLIVAVLGIYQYHAQILRLLHPPAKMALPAGANDSLMLFTFHQCGQPCQDARDDLRARGLTFTEYPLDESRANQDLLHKYTPSNAMPALVAGTQVMSGYTRAGLSGTLASAYGNTVLTPDEREFMNRHFYDDGRPRVVLYGTSWCPYCKRLRESLRSDHIDFLDVDVEAAPDRDRLIKTLEIYGYPVTYIGYERVQGFNYDELKDKMTLAVNR